MENRQKVILVVDDEPHIIELVELYLAKEDFRVVSALDGDSAVEVFRAEEPDLVVPDMLLPGRDGLDVLGEIRNDRRVHVIMLTASESQANRVVGLELDAVDHLTKPFNPGELVARVKAALRSPRVAPGEMGVT
jgi:DNA-binding response OmpR family regulator